MTLRDNNHGSIRSWRRYFPISTVDGFVSTMREVLTNCGLKWNPDLHSSTLTSMGLSDLIPPDSWNSLTSSIPHTSEATAFTLIDPSSIDKLYEPNLAFISILFGCIEHRLTSTTIPRLVGTSVKVKPVPVKRNAFGQFVKKSSVKQDDESSSSTTTGVPIDTCLTIQVPDSPASTYSPASSSTSTTRSSSSNRRRKSSGPPRNRVLLSTSTLPDSRIHQSPDPNGGHVAAPNRLAHPITFDEVEELYKDFYKLIMSSNKLRRHSNVKIVDDTCLSSVSLSATVGGNSDHLSSSPSPASRQLIGDICDVLRSKTQHSQPNLTSTTTATTTATTRRSVRTQTIYSLLTAGQLDSFGLAYTVVAVGQLLGYIDDLALALSEDHAWVVFGSGETADVASYWSSSASTFVDPIRMPPLDKSWLYVNSHPIVCRPRLTCLAALVTSISLPSSDSMTTESTSRVGGRLSTTPRLHRGADDNLAHEVSTLSKDIAQSKIKQLVSLKHRLLSFLFAFGCLNRYPLALTTLADLEMRLEVMTFTPPLALYNQAVLVNRLWLGNQHVYPYISLAGYLLAPSDDDANESKANRRNILVLAYWAEAAKVVSNYCHSNEDREIYREFLEIATHLMPDMVRQASDEARSCSSVDMVKQDADGFFYQHDNVLDDPQCLAYFLAFYDNICVWEQDSPVPVLHVGWVDKLAISLARFTPHARRHLKLVSETANPTLITASPINVNSPQSGGPGRRSRTRTASSSSSSGAGAGTSSFWSAGVDRTSDPDLMISIKAIPEEEESETKQQEAMSYSTAAADTAKNQPTSDQLLLINTETSSHDRLMMTSSEGTITLTKDDHQLYHDASDDTHQQQHDLHHEEASPSPGPLLDFPSGTLHDDDQDSATDLLLTLLADSCDKRLINPAFLSNADSSPFLPNSQQPNADEDPWWTSSRVKLAEAANKLVETVAINLMEAASSEEAEDDNDSGHASLPVTTSSTATAAKLTVATTSTLDSSIQSANPMQPELVSPAATESAVSSHSTSVVVHLRLRSTKMTSIIDLLTSSSVRLNTSAVRLALTAQSSVNWRRSSHGLSPFVAR